MSQWGSRWGLFNIQLVANAKFPKNKQQKFIFSIVLKFKSVFSKGLNFYLIFLKWSFHLILEDFNVNIWKEFSLFWPLLEHIGTYFTSTYTSTSTSIWNTGRSWNPLKNVYARINFSPIFSQIISLFYQKWNTEDIQKFILTRFI